ncbi:MAG: hypothetical protein AAB663_02730 [Patescibacteria group bacterium]
MASEHDIATRAIKDSVATAVRSLPRRAAAIVRRQAIGALLGNILPRFYPADRVLTPKNLVDVLIAIYLSIPSEWRFLAHEVVEESVDAWLPDGNKLKTALKDAVSVTHFASESFLSRNDLTDEKIRAHLGPTLEERFNNPTPGGPVADPVPTPAPPPSYLDVRGKMSANTGLVFDRLLRLAREGVRTDTNPEIEGEARMLRTAIIEEVARTNPDNVNAIVASWGDARIAFLTSTTTADTVFLQSPEVSGLVAILMGLYDVRHPPVVNARVGDAVDNIDTMLGNIGIPPEWRKRLRSMLKLENAESGVDALKNIVYPAVLNVIRGVYSTITIPLGLTLVGIGMASAVYGAMTGEYAIDRETLTFADFLLFRAGGAVVNHLVVIGVGLLYAGTGWYVARRFEARPVAAPDTTVAPTPPNEADFEPKAPWFVEKSPDETVTAYEARMATLEAAADTVVVDGFYDLVEARMEQLAAARVRHAEELVVFERNRTTARKTFEDADDKWRERFRMSLLERVAMIAWMLSIGTSLGLVLGVIAMVWQFQWVTVLMVLAMLFLVGLVVYWSIDDALSAWLKKEAEHAITRGHKFTTTLFIAVIGGVIMYVPGIFTVPPLGARVGSFFVIILVVLAAIFPSRVLAGEQSHDHDAGVTIGKARRIMAGTLPFWVAGIALGVGLIALTGFAWHYNAKWDKECYGYENTPECSALASGGLHTYVDSHERWTAMRNRSATALEKAHKLPGEACAVATRKVDVMARAYSESLNGNVVDTNAADMCEDLERNREEWSDPALKSVVAACAKQKAACAAKPMAVSKR